MTTSSNAGAGAWSAWRGHYNVPHETSPRWNVARLGDNERSERSERSEASLLDRVSYFNPRQIL